MNYVETCELFFKVVLIVLFMWRSYMVYMNPHTHVRGNRYKCMARIITLWHVSSHLYMNSGDQTLPGLHGKCLFTLKHLPGTQAPSQKTESIKYEVPLHTSADIRTCYRIPEKILLLHELGIGKNKIIFPFSLRHLGHRAGQISMSSRPTSSTEQVPGQAPEKSCLNK